MEFLLGVIAAPFILVFIVLSILFALNLFKYIKCKLTGGHEWVVYAKYFLWYRDGSYEACNKCGAIK